MNTKRMTITLLDKKSDDEIAYNLMSFKTNLSEAKGEYRNESVENVTDALTINTKGIDHIMIEALGRDTINIFYRKTDE